MSNRRISISDISNGEPLQWDVFDDEGTLLLRKGFVISQDTQISHLIDRGMFANMEKLDSDIRNSRHIDKASQKQVEVPSVLRMLNTVRAELHRILYNITVEPHAAEQLLALAKQTVQAVTIDPDVAVGCILLNQNGPYGARHSVDTAVLSVMIAKAIRKTDDELVLIAAAALTMNVGMIRAQERFQAKSDELTAEEKQVIRDHPVQSVALLRAAGVDNEDWLNWVLQHHECADGSGYPHGKLSVDTAASAKIISVADRYCARVTPRNYRPALLANAALHNLVTHSKGAVDPSLMALFIRELGAYPIGTFVRLQNGEIGIVTSKGSTNITPYVQALLAPMGAPLAIAVKRNTSKSLHSIREVLHSEQVSIKFTMRKLWGEIAAF